MWVEVTAPTPVGRVVVYARVLSHDQRADLDRQVAQLTLWATENPHSVGEVVAEVGSALNGERPRLRRVLSDPAATLLVMAHRDRLARFGVERRLAVAVDVGVKADALLVVATADGRELARVPARGR